MGGKAEKLLKDLGRKIDNFMVEIDDATENLQGEFKQRFEELKKSKDSLGKDFKDFKDKNKGKWEEVEAKIEAADAAPEEETPEAKASSEIDAKVDASEAEAVEVDETEVEEVKAETDDDAGKDEGKA